MDVSIIHGPVPVLVTLAGPCLLIGALWKRPKKFLTRAVPLFAGIGMAASGAIALGLNVSGTITDHYPPTYLLWSAGTIAAAIVAVAGWPLGSRRQRILALVSVPMMLLFVLEQMNLHYAYYPTLGDALGKARAGEVSASALFEQLAAADASSAVPTTRSAATSAAGATTTAAGTATVVPTTAAPLYDVKGLPRRGKVTEIDIPSTVSGFHARKAWVYLPPAYFASPRPDLPVMMMLAGAPGQPKNWLVAASADKTADAYAATHNGLAPIMVMPDPNGGMTDDTECVDGPRGNAETYLVTDVTAWTVATFHVRADRSAWGVAGLSEGGTCALVLGLRHSDQFSVIGDYSGDLYPNIGTRSETIAGLYGGDVAQFEAHDPALLMASRKYPGVSAWFEAGTAEPRKLADVKQQEAAAARAGMTTRLMTNGGAHNFEEWAQAFRDSLPWFMERFGIVPADPATIASSTSSST